MLKEEKMVVYPVNKMCVTNALCIFHLIPSTFDARTLHNSRSNHIGHNTTRGMGMGYVSNPPSFNQTLQRFYFFLLFFFSIFALYKLSAASEWEENSDDIKFFLLLLLLPFFFPFSSLFPSFLLCIGGLKFCLYKMKMGFI